MNDDVLVVDDFLPGALYQDLAAHTSRQPLIYGSRSNFKTDPHGHWSLDFVAAGSQNLADVSVDLEADEAAAPIWQAWRFLQSTQLSGHVLIRCYVNGYTYGTDGYFHSDSERSDEHTVVVYLNDYWEPDWAGETVFLGEDDDVIKAVLPRRNRAVIFPSTLQHAGRAVSRKCTVLRKTLIFKTRKTRSDDFEKLSVFLRDAGARQCAHRRGTLHDHLVRTFSLLEAKQLDPAVCLGGGLHAIYGTNAFRGAVLGSDARTHVGREFGERAEELAHLFSRIDRPKCLESPPHLGADTATVELADGGSLELRRTVFDDLRKIECANLADQGTLSRHRALSALWETL
ncbi:MAG TPA: 2OG-Fe(II) oxygenase [Mycobacterium sp.]|nr:2OG-Fe(II) oxygenase [Mycobacterium sp.]